MATTFHNFHFFLNLQRFTTMLNEMTILISINDVDISLRRETFSNLLRLWTLRKFHTRKEVGRCMCKEPENVFVGSFSVSMIFGISEMDQSKWQEFGYFCLYQYRISLTKGDYFFWFMLCSQFCFVNISLEIMSFTCRIHNTISIWFIKTESLQ